jgi:hypothetical protein
MVRQGKRHVCRRVILRLTTSPSNREPENRR